MTVTTDLALSFDAITLADLERLGKQQIDALPYGVVGLSSIGMVEIYSQTEARLAGISAKSVMGTHYFSGTAQCMNNFMVAQHFEDESDLDLTIDYVLTLRMRPTPVRLRLLSRRDGPRRYVLIQRIA